MGGGETYFRNSIPTPNNILLFFRTISIAVDLNFPLCLFRWIISLWHGLESRRYIRKRESESGGDPEYSPPFNAEYIYVEWRITNYKFKKKARDTTSHTTDSISPIIFLHQKTQTKKKIAVRLRQQLETPFPNLEPSLFFLF